MTALQHMKNRYLNQKKKKIKPVLSSKSSDNKFEQNIKAQMSAIMSRLLSTNECTRGLVNP